MASRSYWMLRIAQRKILNYLSTVDYATKEEIATATGMTWRKVINNFSLLRSSGYATNDGIYYKITKKGREIL